MGAASNLLTGSTVSGQLAFSALHVATVGRSSGLFSSMGAQGSATNTVFVNPIYAASARR